METKVKEKELADITSFSLPPSLKQTLNEASREHGIKRSQLIVSILTDALESDKIFRVLELRKQTIEKARTELEKLKTEGQALNDTLLILEAVTKIMRDSAEVETEAERLEAVKQQIRHIRKILQA